MSFIRLGRDCTIESLIIYGAIEYCKPPDLSNSYEANGDKRKWPKRIITKSSV